MSIALFSTIGAAFVILIMAAIFIWKYMAEKYKRKIGKNKNSEVV